MATNALISLVPTTLGNALAFDGGIGHYQAVTGVIFADVAYDKPSTPFRRTYLTLLTLDVQSNRPNNPTFVDLDFYNASEVLLSTATEFICWKEVQLSSQIDSNLTAVGMGSRKGRLVTSPAVKVPIAGILDFAGPATLLGLVETLEGQTTTGVERAYSYGVSNNGIPVPTLFFPH